MDRGQEMKLGDKVIVTQGTYRITGKGSTGTINKNLQHYVEEESRFGVMFDKMIEPDGTINHGMDEYYINERDLKVITNNVWKGKERG